MAIAPINAVIDSAVGIVPRIFNTRVILVEPCNPIGAVNHALHLSGILQISKITDIAHGLKMLQGRILTGYLSTKIEKLLNAATGVRDFVSNGMTSLRSADIFFLALCGNSQYIPFQEDNRIDSYCLDKHV